jgi:hydrogenase small subunit
VFYGQTVHESCGRLGAYNAERFAESFDDEDARTGACLLHLGCKGLVTRNACAVTKWNGGTSLPMFSGHGCLGCSEPNFWDRPGGFYESLFT